ncbi:MAG: NADP-dependent isocitrate dehydrogenase, partial [Cyanobacteria bacterium J06635_11]
AVTLEELGRKTNNSRAAILAETLNAATAQLLENDKSPSRKVNELDNRGSHFYLALYWAQAIAQQSKDSGLKTQFEALAQQLQAQEGAIAQDLTTAQGSAVDLGGYYLPNREKAAKAMRPSERFNTAIASL